jgi:hypothetical protein
MNMALLGTETITCNAKGERAFSLIIKYCILAYDHRFLKTQFRL